MITATNIKTNEVLEFENATLAAKHFGAPNLAISAAIRERGGKYGKQPDWIFAGTKEEKPKSEKKEEKFVVKRNKTVDKTIVERVYEDEKIDATHDDTVIGIRQAEVVSVEEEPEAEIEIEGELPF